MQHYNCIVANPTSNSNIISMTASSTSTSNRADNNYGVLMSVQTFSEAIGGGVQNAKWPTILDTALVHGVNSKRSFTIDKEAEESDTTPSHENDHPKPGSFVHRP